MQLDEEDEVLSQESVVDGGGLFKLRIMSPAVLMDTASTGGRRDGSGALLVDDERSFTGSGLDDEGPEGRPM